MTGASAVGEAATKVGSASLGGHEFGYPHGHLGHLNGEEEEALRSFKAYLQAQEDGFYKPGPPASHDDQTLLRYLRARRWVIADAYKQFLETEQWRAANNLNALYENIDLNAYEQARRLYPQWTGRRDRRGIPLYLFEIKHLDNKTVTTYEKSAEQDTHLKGDGSTPAKLLRLFALYENLTRFAQPLCTELPDRPHAPAKTPITLSTNIVDISGVSLKQFWNLKAHMQAASTLATAHYPETLDRIFIIGAPYFFSTVWGWIKRWFDPITVSKIFILSPNEVKSTLEEFIDPKNIPKQYGGQLEFNFFDQPKFDDYVKGRCRFVNGYKDLPLGPALWKVCDENPDELECVAVGTEGGKPRRVRVCTIPRTFNLPKGDGRKEEDLAEKVQGLDISEKAEDNKPAAAAAAPVSAA